MDPRSTPTIDPQALARALDADDRFRRDTGLGDIYHRGQVSFRERSATDSLHIVIQESRVSAHVDRISPLKVRPDGSARYSVSRVVAHNVSGVHRDLVRRLPGQKGREHCSLECEVVWVDDHQPGRVPDANEIGAEDT